MPSLPTIRDQLAEYRPWRADPPQRLPAEAAVALILHEPTGGGGPELLFIERARREGDPWSGQMAFPGGRRQTGDADLQQTAARETLEEVGVTLGPPIGGLDEFAGTRHPHVQPVLVAPYVYEVAERPPTLPNHEVESTVWVPLRWILAPESVAEYRLDVPGRTESFPAFRYQSYTVWGLTYRILGNFCGVLGRGLPSGEGR